MFLNLIRLLPLLILLLTGCQASYYNLEYRFEGQGNYIKDVPFFPQEENYCGPASLASVLGYWGYKITQEEVAREVYTPQLKGTITVDMARYVRQKGLEAKTYKGDIENLKAEVDKGHPLILYLHMGIPLVPKRHYTVAVGYDETKKAIIAYSGRDKDLLIPYEDLLKSWRRTGYWTLLILPK
ncbi:MAG: C39 family peptidase [Deltaproteobacteria bacterium]